LLTRELKN